MNLIKRLSNGLNAIRSKVVTALSIFVFSAVGAYAADPFANAVTPVNDAIGAKSAIQWIILAVAGVLAVVFGLKEKNIWGGVGVFAGTEVFAQVVLAIVGSGIAS